VAALATEIGERDTCHPTELEAAARYIEAAFGDMACDVRRQEYTANRRQVRNIEVELPGTGSPPAIVVIGAHYDTVDTPGANDNGSGVAALLEIARSLHGRRFPRTVRFVAFVHEEPPHFMTNQMGSFVYAARCRERNENIAAMVALETIGFYSDEPGSQRYPPIFNRLYPDAGNFIAFVGNTASRTLLRRAIGSFRSHTSFPSEGVAAPGHLQGIGWSDHWSFWQHGYPGIMVTDTAPFRYPHYHTSQDTADKLDYSRLARVTAGLARMVAELAADKP
jgi:Zn-dependent M28 family amino/carboxypeptidase